MFSLSYDIYLLHAKSEIIYDKIDRIRHNDMAIS